MAGEKTLCLNCGRSSYLPAELQEFESVWACEGCGRLVQLCKCSPVEFTHSLKGPEPRGVASLKVFILNAEEELTTIQETFKDPRVQKGMTETEMVYLKTMPHAITNLNRVIAKLLEVRMRFRLCLECGTLLQGRPIRGRYHAECWPKAPIGEAPMRPSLPPMAGGFRPRLRRRMVRDADLPPPAEEDIEDEPVRGRIVGHDVETIPDEQEEKHEGEQKEGGSDGWEDT